MKNEYGLDVDYFRKKLALIVRDVKCYTPDEMARELLRLSSTASTKVVIEPEFQKLRVAEYEKLRKDNITKS